jgi:hypothetical protein
MFLMFGIPGSNLVPYFDFSIYDIKNFASADFSVAGKK